MIARFLIPLLRGGTALLGGFVLLLALVVLLDRPSALTCLAFGVIGFLALKGAAALWTWQEVLGRLFGPKAAVAPRSPLWIGPRRKRQPSNPLDDDSRSTAHDLTTQSDNELDDIGLYPPEYTPDTGLGDTRRRREDRSWN